jgi:hypothetical protein
MHEDVIAHMRDRAGRLRKVIALAHDPRMIEMLEQVIAGIEADVSRLEQEQQQEKLRAVPPSGALPSR